jgi:transcriptional regulator with XRE-family HTH domain
MDVQERRAVGYRLRRARERMGLERPALAQRLGVHAGSIARWETGGSVPQAYHLERIAEWAGVDADWVRTGEGAEAPEPVEREGEDLFASFDAVVRFLGGIGPAGEARARKMDALEGLRRMLTARGALPDWWYELRDRVEGDAL